MMYVKIYTTRLLINPSISPVVIEVNYGRHKDLLGTNTMTYKRHIL